MITGKEHFGEIKQQQQKTFFCSLGEVFFFFFPESGLESTHCGATMGP